MFGYVWLYKDGGIYVVVYLGLDDGWFVWLSYVLEYVVFVWEFSECCIVFINCLFIF